MPNHIHGILIIKQSANPDDSNHPNHLNHPNYPYPAKNPGSITLNGIPAPLV
jgi:hypothetical protein